MIEDIPGYEFVKLIDPANLQALPIHPTAFILKNTGRQKKDPPYSDGEIQLYSALELHVWTEDVLVVESAESGYKAVYKKSAARSL